MTREEFDNHMYYANNSDEEWVFVNQYIDSLEQQNAELQARIKELDECTDRTISQNRSLILHYENKKCTNCFHSQTDATGNILYCHKKFSKIYGKEVGWDFGCNMWEIL